MFDRGTGPALLVIPGVQGRWEWMRPTLEALARECRTLSYSLCGDMGSSAPMDESAGFDMFSRQIDEVLDRAKLDHVALCGISFGGTIAARYASNRPDRVSALVLTSVPGPSWTPNARQAQYIRRPWLSVAAFCATSIGRVAPEIVTSLPDWPSRIGFACSHAARVVASPMAPGLMARRIRLLQQQSDFTCEARQISAPTLVITGEPRLDHVVPVESTRQYVALIPRARYQMMDGTGHLGLVTQPARYARLVSDFVNASYP
jgi:pimeloyl-ACP methyl ester carboxylesterase